MYSQLSSPLVLCLFCLQEKMEKSNYIQQLFSVRITSKLSPRRERVGEAVFFLSLKSAMFCQMNGCFEEFGKTLQKTLISICNNNCDKEKKEKAFLDQQVTEVPLRQRLHQKSQKQNGGRSRDNQIFRAPARRGVCVSVRVHEVVFCFGQFLLRNSKMATITQKLIGSSLCEEFCNEFILFLLLILR